MRRPRLVYVVTHPVTADLLLGGQLAFMREHGFDVTVIASPGAELARVAERERVDVVSVAMARQPDVRRDGPSLARLTMALRRLRPDIVNAGTPKAGLLGMLAARAVNVPIRIYLLRGLRLETTTGNLRRILSATEKIASACAHDVACVSPSLMRVAVDGGYIPAGKALVVGPGSSNGVDVDRFQRTPELRSKGAAFMRALGIADDAPIIGFVGRLAEDKGIDELLDAFTIVRGELPKAALVLLGGDLGDENIEDRLARRVAATPGVVATKKIADVAPHYARMDVLAFPSYREGFPNVPLEAACAALPVVGLRSTGVIDAVQDGKTGLLVSRNAGRLADAILRYLKDPALTAEHGKNARERVLAQFDRRKIWQAWLDHYRDRLATRGLPPPVG